MRILLYLSPIPAVLFSIFLIQTAGASKIIWIQQLSFLLISIFTVWFLRKKQIKLNFNKTLTVFILLLVGAYFFKRGDSPWRWVELGPFRLYISSILIPSITFIFAARLKAIQEQPYLTYVFYGLFTLVLSFQPDTSQLIAFIGACGLSFILFKQNDKKQFILFVVFILALLWVINQPDPLQPVDYVEGVFRLSNEYGVGLFMLSILVALIPMVCLCLYGKQTKQSELYVVSIYYVFITFIAGLTELTPVPFLGFGASPIFGYYVFLFFLNAERKIEK